MAGGQKTIGTPVLPWTLVGSAAGATSVLYGSAITYGSALGAMVFVQLGRVVSTAFTAASVPQIIVQVSFGSTDDLWAPVAIYSPAIGSNVAATTVAADVGSAATTVVVGALTNIAAGDLIFLGDASTANYEITRVASVAGSTVTLQAPTAFTHSSTTGVVSDQAEQYGPVELPQMATRVRVIVDNSVGGPQFNIGAWMDTLNTVG